MSYRAGSPRGLRSGDSSPHAHHHVHEKKFWYQTSISACRCQTGRGIVWRSVSSLSVVAAVQCADEHARRFQKSHLAKARSASNPTRRQIVRLNVGLDALDPTMTECKPAGESCRSGREAPPPMAGKDPVGDRGEPTPSQLQLASADQLAGGNLADGKCSAECPAAPVLLPATDCAADLLNGRSPGVPAKTARLLFVLAGKVSRGVAQAEAIE